jgi:hypothetical protein
MLGRGMLACSGSCCGAPLTRLELFLQWLVSWRLSLCWCHVISICLYRSQLGLASRACSSWFAPRVCPSFLRPRVGAAQGSAPGARAALCALVRLTSLVLRWARSCASHRSCYAVRARAPHIACAAAARNALCALALSHGPCCAVMSARSCCAALRCAALRCAAPSDRSLVLRSPASHKCGDALLVLNAADGLCEQCGDR